MYPYNINKYQIKNTSAQSNNIPSQIESTYIQPDKRLLEMITNAISDETISAGYYKKLMEIIQDSSDKEIVRGIYADENKHKKLLDDVYFLLTGGYSPTPTVEIPTPELSFTEDFAKSLLNELEDARFYRELYMAFENPEIKDVFFEIITDEQDHAAKFNYLYSKYKE